MKQAGVSLPISSAESSSTWCSQVQVPAILQESKLQVQVEETIRNLTEKRYLHAEQRLGLMVFDLHSSEILAAYNHDLHFQSASMFKVFIALAAFDILHKDKGSLDPDSKEFGLIRTMLVESDNNAANTLMSRFGGPSSIDRYLKSNFPDIAEVKIEELIPDNGASYKNVATIQSYGNLLRHLSHARFEFSSEFLDMISTNQRSRLRGTRTAYVVPDNVSLWHKTGSTSRCCGEAGIVSPSGQIKAEGSYIISAVIEQTKPAFHFQGWIDSVAPIIGSMSALAYEFQRSRYSLEKGFGDLSKFPWIGAS